MRRDVWIGIFGVTNFCPHGCQLSQRGFAWLKSVRGADPEAVAATPLACVLDFADLILDRDGRSSLGKSQGRRTAVLTNQG